MTQMAGQGLQKFTKYLEEFDPSKGPASERNPRFSRDEIQDLYEQGLTMGLSEEAASNAVLKYYDEIKNRGNLLISPKTEDYVKNLRNSQKTIEEETSETTPTPTPLPETTPTPTPDPSPTPKPVTGPYEGSFSTGYLNPYSGVTQGNPVNASTSGDYSPVSTMVDNSINQTTTDMSDNRRYYGGSNRTFNYYGGDGLSKLYDTPVSTATMAGYYDVDDSPAAAASFMDRYIDMNMLHQKDVEKDHKATGNFNYSRSTAAGYDPATLLDSVRGVGRNAYKNTETILDRTFGTMPRSPYLDDQDYSFNPMPVQMEEEDED